LSNKVDHDICFNVFQHSVHVSDVSTAFLHKVAFVYIVYRNNDMLSRYTLGSHVDSRFRLAIIFDYSLNVINVLCLKGKKDFFDFENIFGIAAYLGGLCI